MSVREQPGDVTREAVDVAFNLNPTEIGRRTKACIPRRRNQKSGVAPTRQIERELGRDGYLGIEVDDALSISEQVEL